LRQNKGNVLIILLDDFTKGGKIGIVQVGNFGFIKALGKGI
jgi:hypothetical protein